MNDELPKLIEKGLYVRAAKRASDLARPQDEVSELRAKALWQMAAFNRNFPGTRRLATDFGLGKKELKDLFLGRAGENEGARELEPCYDQASSRYLLFKEWVDLLDKSWEKL